VAAVAQAMLRILLLAHLAAVLEEMLATKLQEQLTPVVAVVAVEALLLRQVLQVAQVTHE
jgi:hypothetical protein